MNNKKRAVSKEDYKIEDVFNNDARVDINEIMKQAFLVEIQNLDLK